MGPCSKSGDYPTGKQLRILLSDDDLLVLARSGDSRADSLHNGDLITLHRVKNFRDLAK